MKNRKLFVRFMTIFVLVLSLLSCHAAALPRPSAEFYVSDTANVLSGETEQHIAEMSKAVAAQHNGMQIVVATVPDLEGSDIESYANALFRDWGIGDSEDNNGLLLLLATGPRKARIEVGYGLEGDINDAKAGRLLDAYALPYYRENQFDEGTRTLYDAVLYELGVSDTQPEKPRSNNVNWKPFLMLLLLFIVLFLNRGRFRRKPYRGGFYGGFGGFRSGGFGGGGFRGGSFGGGGSSGGGGASRGF